MASGVLVMGSFVADVSFRAARLPAWGETLMGETFALGPGGKGSNQAVAAARAGAEVKMFSKLGNDAFGKLAHETWAADRIDASLVLESESATGAAAILIDAVKGENAIIVVPGACFTLNPGEVTAAAAVIGRAKVFLTQLELPLDAVERGLQIARAAGVVTILNPAPACPLPDWMIALADYLIPNESEAALLTELPVETVEDAERAANALIARGAGTVIVTLGAKGALLRTGGVTTMIPAFTAGALVETTGAGDAFCGAFAAGLAEGMEPVTAARFASAAAGISVTRVGTAPSMAGRGEIESLMKNDE